MSKKTACLIIEDELTILVMLTEMLAKLTDVEVEGKRTLRDGLRELDSKPYDVVMLDLSLPDSENLDGLIAVRRLHPEVPIIVVTGSPQLKREAMELGAKVFVEKPPSPNQIREAVIFAANIKQKVEEDFAPLEQGRVNTEKEIAEFHRLENELKGKS